jgi:hypothetical protein
VTRIGWRRSAERSPLAAALLSFALPGLGELFVFRTERAVATALLSILLINTPLLASLTGIAPVRGTMLLAVASYFLLMLFSAIDAAAGASRGALQYRNAGSLASLLLFSLLGVALLSVSLAAAGSRFSLHAVADDYGAPTVRRGELVLLEKNIPAARGELIRHQGGLHRVIVTGAADVTVFAGRVRIGDMELAFEEFPGGGRDVFLERNGEVAYPVHLAVDAPRDLSREDRIRTAANEVLLLADNRNVAEPLIRARGPAARAAGVILSPRVTRILPGYPISVRPRDSAR